MKNRKYLILDLGSNRETRKGNTLLKTGLDDQYDRIRSEGMTFESFFRIKLLGDEVRFYISYPNFDRVPYIDQYKNQFYQNIAVRVSDGSPTDLVLMGDIIEYEGARRIFSVKGITKMDSKTIHYGELNLDCKIIIDWRNNSPRYEDAESVYEWQQTEWRIEQLLNDDFMIELGKRYVVDDVNSVKKELDDWQLYLDSSLSVIDVKEKEEFDISKNADVEVMRAYFKEKSEGVDNHANSVPFLNPHNKRNVWTIDSMPDSEARALIHICVDYKNTEYTESFSDKKYNLKKKLDSFTRESNIITDPAKDNLDKDRKYEGSIVLGDKRIGISTHEHISPIEEINNLKSERESLIERTRREIDARAKENAKAAISEFKNRELPSIEIEFKERESTPVTKRTISRIEKLIFEDESNISKKIESKENESQSLEATISEYESDFIKLNEELKNIEKDPDTSESKDNEQNSKRKKDSPSDKISANNKKIERVDRLLSEKKTNLLKYFDEIANLKQQRENVSAKYDLEYMVKEDLDKLWVKESSRLIENRFLIESKNAKNNLEPSLNKRLREIEEDFESKIQTAEYNNSIARFHIYYELETDSDTLESKIEKNRNDLKMLKRKVLRRDMKGDRTLLGRQKDALQRLRRGEVNNPFLATALFSPASSGSMTVEHIDKFLEENLNNLQKEAIESALSANGTFLIQGPPGTGKTQVIAEITAQLAMRGKKILIASENHKAVDNAFAKLPKIPVIRPIRIMSTRNKDNNQYSVDSLVGNFYRNISHSLNNEVRRHDNHKKYEEEMDIKITELNQKISRMRKLEDENKMLRDDILNVEINLSKERERLQNLRNKNAEISESLSESESKLSDLTPLDIDGSNNLIKNALEFTSDDEQRASDLILELHRMNIDDIVKQISKSIQFKDYLSLLSKKEDAPTKEIPGINEKIASYRENKNIKESDLKLVSFIGYKEIPEEIIELKTLIDETLEDLKRIERSNISINKKLIKDTGSLEQSIRKLEYELTEYRSGDSIKEIKRVRNNLNRDILTIFSDLNVVTSFNDPEEALKILNDERKRIAREVRNPNQNVKKLISAYRTISEYLSNESLIEEDSDKYVTEMLNHVNVVGTTCTSRESFGEEISRVKIGEMNIDVVIIDEVSKIPFIELLQPILNGKTVILVGDHKQLSPMYNIREDECKSGDYDGDFVNLENEKKFETMFETSFFEKLFRKTPEQNKTMLRTQYRMHPQIMEVVNMFYPESILNFGGSEADKEHHLTVKGPGRRNIISPENHLVFIDVDGFETQESGSKSFSNKREAEVVSKLLILLDSNCKLDRDGNIIGFSQKNKDDKRLSMGVICPYKDQVDIIRRSRRSVRFNSFNDSIDERLEIKSVDDFQGDERDIIILSMVRTDKNAKFLKNYHRINVAMSRARRLLIIVGNEKILSTMKIDIDNGKSIERRSVYAEIASYASSLGGKLSGKDIVGGE